MNRRAHLVDDIQIRVDISLETALETPAHTVSSRDADLAVCCDMLCQVPERTLTAATLLYVTRADSLFC